jgi:2-oxoglutarate ferredoxin oxidoreductase subunit beta
MNVLNSFESCREVKWCPGCGNYAILMTVQKTLQSLGISNKNTVFISGIGCSGRFPYYVNSYGFHTLHGRAPALATGLCLTRDDLNVWLVIGDGDGFSIGLAHVLHMVRRNINLNVLFINNKIYALTKGQYSPTTEKGTLTKSSPFGSLECSINPLLMILSAGCTFVARAVDNDSHRLKDLLLKGFNHKGTSFIEILQNCNVFNNKIYFDIADSENRLNKVMYLEHGKQLSFGNNNEKKLCLSKNLSFYVSEKESSDEYLLHDANSYNFLQPMLASFSFYDTPFPLGLFRSVNRETHEESFFLEPLIIMINLVI